jgi:hypothetical protein
MIWMSKNILEEMRTKGWEQLTEIGTEMWNKASWRGLPRIKTKDVLNTIIWSFFFYTLVSLAVPLVS